MKGTTFAKPLEYTFITQGEEWKQGEIIKGVLHIRNHGQAPVTIEKIRTMLAHASFRKVHAQDPRAWTKVEELVLASQLQIPPGQSQEFSWQFQLSNDCPITDKNASLYLLYGSSNDAWPAGSLQLTVDLRPMLFEFVKIFQDFYRFQIKEKKYRMGMVEIKLLPPKSRECANIEVAHCLLRLMEDTLEVNYIFSVQELEISGGGQALSLIHI